METEGQNKRLGSAKRQSGQLVLEYVLLMLLAVSMATLARNEIMGEAETCEEARILSRMVCSLTDVIANDLPGE